MKPILVPFERFQGKLSPFRVSSGGNRFGVSFGPMTPILLQFETFQGQLSPFRASSGGNRFGASFGDFQ